MLSTVLNSTVMLTICANPINFYADTESNTELLRFSDIIARHFCSSTIIRSLTRLKIVPFKLHCFYIVKCSCIFDSFHSTNKVQKNSACSNLFSVHFACTQSSYKIVTIDTSLMLWQCYVFNILRSDKSFHPDHVVN